MQCVRDGLPLYLGIACLLLRGAASTALDADGKRSDIAEKTGVVVGVANASLSVERGAISVLMGLSGSGKSTLLRAANGLNHRRHRSDLRCGHPAIKGAAIAPTAP